MQSRPTKTLTVRADQHGTTLVIFIADTLKLSGKKAKQILDSRRVTVNNRPVWIAKHVLQKRDKVSLPAEFASSDKINILYEDATLTVINKPWGLLATGTGMSAQSIMHKHNDALRPVHRLDRDTSGCMIFAAGPQAIEELINQFKARAVHKEYLGLVTGKPAFQHSTAKDKIQGQHAHSEITVIKSSTRAALVQVKIITGRTHQVRIHLARLGHPILGDQKYGARSPAGLKIDRQMLHCGHLSFVHPEKGSPLKVFAPLPADFIEASATLRLK